MATEDKLNDYDFTGTDAGASHTIPSEAGQIRKGGYIVIKGHPCKVQHLQKDKTGRGAVRCGAVRCGADPGWACDAAKFACMPVLSVDTTPVSQTPCFFRR